MICVIKNVLKLTKVHLRKHTGYSDDFGRHYGRKNYRILSDRAALIYNEVRAVAVLQLQNPIYYD